MSNWNTEFKNRMERFETQRSFDGDGFSLSVKIRVTSGCFHREHSPNAYDQIDQWLSNHAAVSSEICFEEHETGPELLLWLAVVSGSISLATSIVNLITTILKSRADGIKKGDKPSEPLELIVRRTVSGGEYKEEIVLRVGNHELVDAHEIESKLEKAIRNIADKPMSM